jgi:hypothetical protein
MIRRVSAVAFASLLAVLSIPGPLVSAIDVNADRLAAEVRFRVELGLASDEAFVRQLIQQRPGSDFPTLTDEEQIEFDRRIAMEREMAALEEKAEAIQGLPGIGSIRGRAVSLLSHSTARQMITWPNSNHSCPRVPHCKW